MGLCGLLSLTIGMTMAQADCQVPSWYAQGRGGCGFGYTTGMRGCLPGLVERLRMRALERQMRLLRMRRWNGEELDGFRPKVRIILEIPTITPYSFNYE